MVLFAKETMFAMETKEIALCATYGAEIEMGFPEREFPGGFGPDHQSSVSFIIER